MSGTIAAIWPCWPATRPALAATRPGQGPRYGHYARTWACLGAQFGQLGAYAPDLVFRPGFRLSTVFLVAVWTRIMNTVHNEIFSKKKNNNNN